jgi:hypothetical protein
MKSWGPSGSPFPWGRNTQKFHASPELDYGRPMSGAHHGHRRRLNIREHGLVGLKTTDGFRYGAAVCYFADGSRAEIFLNDEKPGSPIEAAARDALVVASRALQHDVPPETIRRAAASIGGRTTIAPPCVSSVKKVDKPITVLLFGHLSNFAAPANWWDRRR